MSKLEEKTQSAATEKPGFSSGKTILISLVILVVGVASAYYLRTQLPTLNEERAVSHNVGFYILINLNIVVVMLLCFLVAKNIIKLILDRRRNILGSRLRTRLVVAFVGLSLVPTVLLFATAKGIVDSALSGWFSPQVQSTVDGALDVAKYHYIETERRLESNLNYLVEGVQPILALVNPEGEELKEDSRKLVANYLESKRREYGLEELTIYKPEGDIVVRVSGRLEGDSKVVVPALNLSALSRAKYGNVSIQPEQSLSNEFLRGYVPIYLDAKAGLVSDPGNLVIEPKNELGYVLVGTVWIKPELSGVLARVVDSYDDYRELHTYKRPLASSYLLTLIGAMLLLVFAAVWIGFYLAKSLSVPIQKLAEATEQVAHGNLEHKIPEVGDDELGVLVHSFNTMVSDLKRTTGELDSRRRYTEAILASVGIGVVSVDRHGCVTTCNDAALQILGIDRNSLIINEKLEHSIKSSYVEQIVDLLSTLFASKERVISGNVYFDENQAEGAGEKHLHVTLTKLVSDRGSVLGAVILLDDLSELVRAQRMAAWRDVARRIAHEIKNPLTPIQLSAQRLQRRVIGEGGLSEEQKQIATDCTNAIVKQVETLRSLVNEFYQFARMPKANPKPVLLNDLINETVSVYQDTDPEIDFELRLDPGASEILLDKDQIRRVLVNLIDNGIASINAYIISGSRGNGERGKISIESNYNSDLSIMAFSVADNGFGLADSEKSRVFEPYYSTRESGTGLGLSIVSSIIADHSGFIRVRDNTPRGARFVVELPISGSSAASGLTEKNLPGNVKQKLKGAA